MADSRVRARYAKIAKSYIPGGGAFLRAREPREIPSNATGHRVFAARGDAPARGDALSRAFAVRDDDLSRAVWRVPACAPPGEIRVRPLAHFVEPAVAAEDMDDDATIARWLVRSDEVTPATPSPGAR